jgi:hypothetical protein
VWNLSKKVNGSFDFPNSVKYPFTLHSPFLWKGCLNCIVDLTRTYASFIVTPPRHVEAPGHEGGYEILSRVYQDFISEIEGTKWNPFPELILL